MVADIECHPFSKYLNPPLKRPCTTYLLLVQYKEMFFEGIPPKLLNKIVEKYLRKSSFLAKLQILKINSFTRVFQDFC